MAIVKEGCSISIVLEAKLETGEIVLKTEEGCPLKLTVGQGAIPPPIEKVLVDMDEGESKTITLESTEAFGPRLNDLIIELPKKGFNSDVAIEVGSIVKMESAAGKTYAGIVLEIGDENVKVDFNHPLAGKNLVFTITVVSID